MSHKGTEMTVVGIGELLWDLLPEGRQLGGAPANFAYHAKVLCGSGIPVSCIGADELGADDSAIREQACKDGMKPLRVSGAMKVAQGLTTAEEVLKVAPLA